MVRPRARPLFIQGARSLVNWERARRPNAGFRVYAPSQPLGALQEQLVHADALGHVVEAQQVGQLITERDLNRQPTIQVRAGWPLRVIVNKDMILAPYQ